MSKNNFFGGVGPMQSLTERIHEKNDLIYIKLSKILYSTALSRVIFPLFISFRTTFLKRKRYKVQTPTKKQHIVEETL